MSRTAFDDLRLPLLQAPMFLVSSDKLAIACAKAGIVGAFQLANPVDISELETWLDNIAAEASRCAVAGDPFAPICVNVNANAIDTKSYGEKFKLCEAARIPLVLSSIGDPTPVVARVHDWGGHVIHDVTTLRFAEKAIAAGVEGLMLACAGAGGHTGALSPFAFLPQVREMFDGLIILAGGIAESNGIRGALALGAGMVCMGTRFVATQESAAPLAYKEMLVSSATKDVLETDAIAGLGANWLIPSIEAAGLNPQNLPTPKRLHVPDLPKDIRAWKDIWSGGHTTGMIHDVPSVAELMNRYLNELSSLHPGWQQNIEQRLGME
jgi:nitronate monooxygenase